MPTIKMDHLIEDLKKGKTCLAEQPKPHFFFSFQPTNQIEDGDGKKFRL
jgi:hypothetical protein